MEFTLHISFFTPKSHIKIRAKSWLKKKKKMEIYNTVISLKKERRDER